MRCGRGIKYMKMPGTCTGQKVGEHGGYLGGHDLVRRMDRQGEVLTWCRKCSGYARQRMGPKLMNCCRPEQMGTKEFGKSRITWIIIQVDGGLLERLIETEDEEVCPRHILKYSTREAIFSSSLTRARKRTIPWQTEGVGWSTKERG